MLRLNMNRMFFSTILLTFVALNSAQTIDQCTRSAICYSGERTGDPSDCLKFYECDFLGVWKVKTCNNGQQFDSASLTCVTNDMATCLDCEQVPGRKILDTTISPQWTTSSATSDATTYVNYSYLACDPSRRPLTLTSYSGVIEGYAYYDFGAPDCRWLIISAEPHGVVVITFTYINTYAGYGYLYVYDGIDERSSVIVALTGYNPPRQPYYSSTQTHMLVQFYCNYYYGDFNAQFFAAERFTTGETPTSHEDTNAYQTTSDATTSEATLFGTTTTPETTSEKTTSEATTIRVTTPEFTKLETVTPEDFSPEPTSSEATTSEASESTTTELKPIDPCNKPTLCIGFSFLPNPENCRQYFACNFDFTWTLQTCSNGLLFNNISLTCRNDYVSCAEPCPPFTGIPSTTLSPGLCDDDNIAGECINGNRVPDRSDCLYYYQCIRNAYMRYKCSVGFGFDIDNSQCVPLSATFDCDYRCKTPIPTTARTTTSYPTTEDDSGKTTAELTTINASISYQTHGSTTVHADVTTVIETTTSKDAGVACSSDSRPLELQGYSGSLESPNYPGSYWNDANCQWRITAVVLTAVVTLDFEFFSTESCCDFVELLDGDNSKSPSIISLSGSLSPPPVGFNSTQRSMFIRLTTDSTITDRGFSATYTSAAPGDPCSPMSRPLELSGYSGSFASSNFPNDYFDNSDCQWKIVAEENSGVVQLYFDTFNTESCCDIVDLHDGDTVKSPLITVLSGSYDPPPGDITSSQRYMFMRFKTDSTDTFGGFSATFTCGDPCSSLSRPLQLKAPAGSFTSSNYPSNYGNDADCQWLISTTRPNSNILLSFSFFDTESCCDTVSIFDGNNLKAPLIAKLFGSYTTPPGGFESTQQHMYMRFTTDDSINSRGFKATYTTEGPGNACSPIDRPLDLTGNSGTLTSSNFPSYYDNDADCQWRITAINIYSVVVVDFDVFDTESCCDKLFIYDGDNNKSPSIITLSGSFQTPPTGVASTQIYMFLRFTSDDSITGRGFTSTYRSST